LVAILLTVTLAPPVADARNRKAEKLVKEGRAAEARKDWDKALELYDQALALDPADAGYQLLARRTRFYAGQAHVDAAEKLRDEGKLEEALAEFQRALFIDPASSIALQEIKRTHEMIQKEKGAPAPKQSERGLTPAQKARREMEDRIASLQAPPELRPITRQISSLKMNNQPPKVLYETVGKLAGINVVFDSQYSAQGRSYNVDLANSNIEEALDYVAVLTKTYWKPISSNTIFVTEDNITKRRDYEDEVVRVFYVTNTTSVQEFQEIATAVRTLADLRRVFTYNAQRAMVVRGTKNQVALAEKVIYDLDRPKAEVVVDVIVMEANSSRTRDLALTIASAGKAGLNIPVVFQPRNAITRPSGSDTGGDTTAQGFVRLNQLGRLSTADWATTLPGALLNALLTDRSTRVLQSPQVRASDGMKVSLRLGDRIPFATGSFQPGLGGVGVNPLVSTQFNFADVGVNVDLTPQVHSADELTIHVEVEVSTVRDRIDIGGVSQPIIGQRKSVADIRLKEGEVNILGGLSGAIDSRSVTGIPGLIQIPALGEYLGSNSVNRERSELLIALVPYIIRTPDVNEQNLRGILSGTDQIVRLKYAPPTNGSAPPPGADQPGVPSPVVVEPKPTDQPKPAAPVPPPGAPRAFFNPAATETALGGVISIPLQVENVTDLFAASPIRVKFDPQQLRLEDIVPGEFFSRDGLRVSSVKDIRNDTGDATITINRLPGAGGVRGAGAVALLRFQAIGRGQSKVTVSELGLKNLRLENISVPPAELDVTVK
jgi:general secretion pathway protein D